ncbi:MAG: Lrp/AsnC family transcriptional regulator [Candidatus Methanolliviera hydrocarbonicum]|uniref:Lrp/AsnC family transcriptional regulator n=1 Tax=Candidatus Methanolliviera hydrocarbonicum TaxID=2491085 RepID=A0A520KX24_9EURY|nr:MAG: Lrp/AsnC family transcriptional regulator [Candidatus Methanolliviera hydrocarbonicum]
MTVLLIMKSELGRVKDVAEKLSELPETSEVYLMTGEYDIIAKIEAEPEEAIDLILEKILKIEGISKTRTIFTKKIK